MCSFLNGNSKKGGTDMKKLSVYALMLALTLLFTSCGGQTTTVDTSESTDERGDSSKLTDAVDTDDGTDGGADAFVIDNTPLTDARKAELYDIAGEALSVKGYQYAYGIYMRLASEGYLDSAQKARDIISDAYATPIDFVSKKCFSALRDVTVIGDGGFLYIDEKGTPQFIYATKNNDDSIKINSLTPYPSLTNVRSIAFSTSYLYADVWVCVLLTDDGRVKLIYDEVTLAEKAVPSTSSDKGQSRYYPIKTEIEEKLIPFIDSLSDVVKISYHSEDINFACLHSDGRVSVYTSADDEPQSLEGVVDMTFNAPGCLLGLDAEGNIVGFDSTLGIEGFDSIHFVSDYFINAGKLYMVDPAGKARLALEDVVYAAAYTENAVNNNIEAGFFILEDGKIVNVTGAELGDAGGSCVYYKKDLGYSLGACLYIIGGDGKVIDARHENMGEQDFYEALLGELKNCKIRIDG